MSELEIALVTRIRESADPEKALVIAIDILSRCVTGESIESIAASHGFNWGDITGRA